MPHRLKLLWALAAAFVVVGLAWYGYHRFGYLLLTEEEKLALRQQARAEWLQIVARGEANKEANAKVLARCFAKGESEAELKEILATGTREHHKQLGVTKYHWLFHVEKPENDDATGLVVTVYLEGAPLKINEIWYAYTVD